MEDRGRWRRRVAVALAVGYPLGLVTAWAILRFAGTVWWPALVGLYAPPWGFLLPAPFVLAVTWRWARRRWLALQLVAVVLAVFGLLGLRLGLGRSEVSQASQAVRMVSYNIGLGKQGLTGIMAQVRTGNPDLVLLQEAQECLVAELQEAFAGWHTDLHGQFFIATRFPIVEVREPPALHYTAGEGGSQKTGEGGAHFMAYTLDTPLGPIDVFNVHTTSPREGLEEIRGNGFGYELRQGHFRLGGNVDRLKFNAYRRARQVQNMAAVARAAHRPVLIAGDFNLPAMSRLMHDHLGDFADAFDQAGRGFGYTYPSKLPFLRIDRIFTGHGLQAVSFEVGETRASDHLCIRAVVVASKH